MVWQKSLASVKQVYLISKDGELNRDFSLGEQLRHAALAIPTNIAEGFERASRKEYLIFLIFRKDRPVK